MSEDASQSTPMPAAAGRLMRAATYASVSVAGTLVAVKLAAWLATDSVSLLSTMIDSLLDMAASVVNLLAVRRALRPADRSHRFGHGKAEALSGLAQSAFISGSALFLVFEAGKRLVDPRAVVNTEIGYAVMVLAIVLTLALVVFQKFVVRRTGSVAITADSIHYQSDLLINASVILSLFLATEWGWTAADPIFAIAIAGYLAWGAIRIGLKSLELLMDHELPQEDRKRIQEIALAHPSVIDMHDLRTRSSGTRVFIQLHLEMSGEITLIEAHEISDQVMYKILDAFPNAEVLIHEDPEGIFEHVATFE